MHTLTLPEKQALKLSDPDWYEAVALTDEEAGLLIAKMRADDMPAFMREVRFGVRENNGARAHVAKLGKQGSSTALRRRRYLERLGCVESETEQVIGAAESTSAETMHEARSDGQTDPTPASDARREDTPAAPVSG